MIKCICYNYQSQEFAPLGGWDSLNRLTATRHPEDTLESDQYDKFKTFVEVCKASGINFTVMCSANIDMAIAEISSTGEMMKTGTYKSGTYFQLKDDEINLVDYRSEEIFLSTRLLFLSSNKLPYQSKQELKNNLTKGDDNYPRTISGCLNFLQHHSLRGIGGEETESS